MSVLVVLQKPKWGEPCNRCGLCCTRELCRVGMDHFRPGHGPYSEEWQGVCPALSFDGFGVASCGLFEEVKTQLMMGGCFVHDHYHNFGKEANEQVPATSTQGVELTATRLEASVDV